MMPSSSFYSIPVLLIYGTHLCYAVIPSAIIEVSSPLSVENHHIFAGIATFGPDIPFKKGKATSSSESISDFLPLRLAPPENSLLCEDADPSLASKESYIIVVPRGQCSFERKTRNGEILGAAHVIVYDTLSAKYGANVIPARSLDDVLWPNARVDYECKQGEAWIPMNELYFNNLPYDTSNDALLKGSSQDGNLCALYHNIEEAISKARGKFQDTCLSKRCLLTNKFEFNPSTGTELMQACCAWDIHLNMGGDDNINDVNITSTFLTMRNGDDLVKMVQDNQSPAGNGNIQAKVYLRWYPNYNFSSVLICILGTFVTWISGWRSARSYRIARSKLEAENLGDLDLSNNEDHASSTADTGGTTTTNHHHQESLDIRSHGNLDYSYRSTTTDNGGDRHDILSTREAPTQLQPSVSNSQEIVNLKYYHAILFVIFASGMLLLLFFTKLYDVARVLYLIGGIGSMVQVVIHPALTFIFKCFSRNKNVFKPICHCRFGLDITLIDVFSGLIGVSIGATWLWISFTMPNVQMYPYYWIVQNVIGICVCIVFLEVVRLNSIKIASLLLIAAFIYDIFFVFITPHIFGESVMITVATGGGAATDAYHCEKYPSDGDCDNTPLPMLFAIPKINDYRGGLSMLGLGDIILPGLICCFAARLDAAKHLIAAAQAKRLGFNCDVDERFSKNVGQRLCSGYFFFIIVAYAIGLALANIAVYLMEQGQPALMYLVPLTLFALVFQSRMNGELTELWKGPKRIQMSDELVDILKDGCVNANPDDFNRILDRSIATQEVQ